MLYYVNERVPHFYFNILKRSLFHLPAIHVLHLSNDIYDMPMLALYTYIEIMLKLKHPVYPPHFGYVLFILISSISSMCLHIWMLIMYMSIFMSMYSWCNTKTYVYSTRINHI
jgi:hypothetical protein